MSRPVVAFAKGAWQYPSARALVGEHAEVVEEDRVAEAAGLYCDSNKPRVDAAYLDQAPLLRIIASASVGYDNIDVAECTRRGIAFSNSRGSLTQAVADVAYLLVLSVFRHFGEGAGWVRDGKWPSGDAPYGDDLEGSTLGIVGMGAIGLALAKRARASGMRIVYCNRHHTPNETEVDARHLTFEALLRTADCVIVLTPLTDETRGMFGREQFALMKPSAYFVNVARGKVVQTEALFEALAGRQIAGAALDVTDPEPLPPEHPLLSLPNALIVPHIGSATHQTRERMSLYAARNLIAGIQGKPLPQIVNSAVYESAARSGSSRV
ncbi:MAG TPA: D-glycerate dehydrogenase [Candidatus Binatia bacterium]|nr:D-glycerate dehydrogenase [Candidatus Binatia bacterium]